MRNVVDEALPQTGLPPRDLILRSPPSWLVVLFPALLGSLHYAHAISSLLAGHWAGYLSLVIGTLLFTASGTLFFFRLEVSVLPGPRVIRTRHGVGRFSFVRTFRFSDVRAVRLTLDDGGRSRDAVIELLCPGEDVLCPPTAIPRQEALYLAMVLDVPLVKVSSEDAGHEETAEALDARMKSAGTRMVE